MPALLGSLLCETVAVRSRPTDLNSHDGYGDAGGCHPARLDEQPEVPGHRRQYTKRQSHDREGYGPTALTRHS